MDVNDVRVVALIDMDCFYVQVEQKLSPEYVNKPCAVAQYNTWKGGSIIAVNYEARALGVKRGMRGDEAKFVCPDIHLFHVPEVRGKADLTRYREAGASVIAALKGFCDDVERASIDEAYLDLTAMVLKEFQKGICIVSLDQLPNSFVVGWEEKTVFSSVQQSENSRSLEEWLKCIYEEDDVHGQMLAFAASSVEKMRKTILEKTNFECSAGISHNKMLAKLACGLHKPNRQSILPNSSVPILYASLSINKVRNLGGKLGEEVVKKLGVSTMLDLGSFSERDLQSHFGEKNGTWLFDIAKGIENEPVVPRQLPKSIGCGKNFPGKAALNTFEKVSHWIQQLSLELEERLLKDQLNNSRLAHSLTVTMRQAGCSGNGVVSRTCPIYAYDAHKFVKDILSVLCKFNKAVASPAWCPAILSLAMSAGKFKDKISLRETSVANYFSPSTSLEVKSITNLNCANTVKSWDTENLHISSSSTNERETVIDSCDHLTGKETSPTKNCIKKENKETIHACCDKKKIRLSTQNSFFKTKESGHFSVKGTINNYFSSKSISERKIGGDFQSSDWLDESCCSVVKTVKNEIAHQSSVSDPEQCSASEQTFPLHIDKLRKFPDESIDEFCDGKQEVEKLSFPQRPNLKQTKAEISDSSTNGFFAKKSEECEYLLSSKSTKSFVTEVKYCSSVQQQNEEECHCSVQPFKLQLCPIENAEAKSTTKDGAMPVVPVSLHEDEINILPELLVRCERCSEQFPVWRQQEHADFHLAVDLSAQSCEVNNFSESKSCPLQYKQISKVSAGAPNVKRKTVQYSNPLNVGKRPKSKLCTLDSYFK